MPRFFHQNMRVFGGGNVDRINAYRDAFQTIGGSVQIDVAGFTEITNNNAAWDAIDSLATDLLGNNRETLVVACGRTALARTPEFIAISIRDPAEIEILGVSRILFQVSQGALTLVQDRVMATNAPDYHRWASGIPDNVSADYRGIVYIIAKIGSINFAIGFIHNLYTLNEQRITVRNRVPDMLQLMSQAPGITVPIIPYLLGDFNLYPENVGTPRTGRAIAVFDPVTPTTAGGNIYDYVYVRENDVPHIIGTTANITTQAPDMSNHTSIYCQTNI